MKKLFLSVTLLFSSSFSMADDDTQKQSKLQKLCALFMEETHSCHREGTDESILKELAKRGILEHDEFKSGSHCVGPWPPRDE